MSVCVRVRKHFLLRWNAKRQKLVIIKAGVVEIALLECLSVYGPVSLLVVLPLGNPHLLEGVQGGQDGAADPRRVQPLLRRRDPDLDVLGR